MNSNFAISLSGIEKLYKDRKAVDGVSFDVKKGEIFGLLGPNGAGKTTTISMLTGLVPPSAGNMSIFGESHTTKKNGLKKIIGIAPQSLTLYPTLSAYDNLRFFGGIYGFKGSALDQTINRVLEIVGLRDRAKDIVENFSGGMQRRLNLAIALIHDPKVLFLDEPTVGVDPQSRNLILEAIQELNSKGTTVVYTTHYMEEAERLCNRIAIMDGGKIIALDTPDGLRSIVGQGYFRVGIINQDLASLIQDLQANSVVKEIRLHDTYLEIEAHLLQEALMTFMDISNKLKLQLSSLNVFESNLESVFLKLTGKQLRDH